METTTINPVENNVNVLDFTKDKVQIITLDQLRRSAPENNINNEPLMGRYHYQIVDEVQQMCREFGYETEIYDMFAAQNGGAKCRYPGVSLVKPLQEKFGEQAVEAHLLRRVYTNIRVTNFDNDEHTTNLAVSYHQGGIQIGMGRMVKICHNQCMLNADLYASTYSERKKDNKFESIDDVMCAVRSWLENAKALMEKDERMIQKMKSIPVPAERVAQTIGLLTAIRVKADTKYQEIHEYCTYPLNQSQISLFTEALMLAAVRNGGVTVWDMYNAATELYKADQMDIPNIITQNRQMVEFLNNEFSLEY